MYRERIYQEVLYGHFKEFMQIAGSFRALARERGWPESTLWIPTAGRGNVAIWETEYPDLAAFQRQNEAVYSDGEAMDIIRRFSDHVVQGSVHTELLEEAPSIA